MFTKKTPPFSHKKIHFHKKNSIRVVNPGSKRASNLAINSKIKSKKYESIKCKMNGCIENIKSVYKNYLLLQINIVYPKMLSKNKTSPNRVI